MNDHQNVPLMLLAVVAIMMAIYGLMRVSESEYENCLNRGGSDRGCAVYLFK